MTDSVAVIGYGATPVGRLCPRGEEPYQAFEHDVLTNVTLDVLERVGVDRHDVGSAVFTAPSPATAQLGFATFMAARLGLNCTAQIAEVANLGITGGLAFDQAAADIQTGRTEVALALGVEFNTGVPVSMIMDRSMRVVGDVDFQAPFGLTPIAWYAFDAARYMYEYNVTRADLAAVAVKNRQHAALNPLAQFRSALTVDDVLAQRPIVEPLGLYDVPPVSDGAVCLVLSSEAFARRRGKPYVRVRGRGFHHDGYHQLGRHPHDMIAFPAASTAAQRALDEARVKLADIDVAELYAPCTITEVLVTEALGLVAKGQGTQAVLAGETALGGRIPVSTSGGCLSRGHPPGLTALYGIVEAYEQLLGQAGERQVPNARLALHCCELGNYNAALVHILESVA